MKGYPADYERFAAEVAWLRSFGKSISRARSKGAKV